MLDSRLAIGHYALPNAIDIDLYNAIENDDPAKLRRLLSSGMPPIYYAVDMSPLHHAVDADSDFHSQANTPLDLRLIGPLIEAGADINALTRSNGRAPETPLDYAIGYHNDIAIDVLTKAGGRRASALDS